MMFNVASLGCIRRALRPEDDEMRVPYRYDYLSDISSILLMTWYIFHMKAVTGHASLNMP
eukprot:scaffold121229_cov60-Attheya_sp.AAC.3